MLWVFTFVGEFGYELLNWQGVVRRFARYELPPGDRIVCCSRGEVGTLYESAIDYVEIGSVPEFRSSRAVRYWSARTRERLTSSWDRLWDLRLRRALRRHVEGRLRERGRWSPGARFVFSSLGTRIGSCRFGATGYRYSVPGVVVSDLAAFAKWLLPSGAVERVRRGKRAFLEGASALDYRGDGDIYDRLDLENNLYRRIDPDLSRRGAVERELGWSLDEPFVLVQGRRRDKPQSSRDVLPAAAVDGLLRSLASRCRVLVLDFSTGRWLDSYSAVQADAGYSRYVCRSFVEQSCLVAHARHCVFFSEGDLGSHTYVPPLMGRDVSVVAPGSVFALASSPVDFWNRSVFRFGGQLLPLAAEELAGAGGAELLARLDAGEPP